MKKLDDNSVDSIVTDPPYGLSFMGKKWDYDVPSVAIWREALRVLKPGGHLLSFAGSRTYHRMAVNIEDAGFEIRDQIMWIYGSGFPKSHNISKGIDKKLGAEREMIRKPFSPQQMMMKDGQNERPWQNKAKELGYHETASDEPASPEAKQWQGWGTALKPAHEPVVVARKPLIGTVAENILEHGVGGINIEESRVGDEHFIQEASEYEPSKGVFSDVKRSAKEYNGRFPANIIFDAEAAAILNEQSGDCKTGAIEPYISDGSNSAFISDVSPRDFKQEASSGGASRFFKEVNFSEQEHTPIVLARKPIEGTVAENVLEHGVGGINIDECRIGNGGHLKWETPRGMGGLGIYGKANDLGPSTATKSAIGRFPANIILDAEAGAILDEQSGESIGAKGTGLTATESRGRVNINNSVGGINRVGYEDKGGASRFFYCAKASTGERNEGLESLESQTMGNHQSSLEGGKMLTGSGNERSNAKNNFHPTVKPIALMEYLCRLVTPKGGTVLDPFMGSGTTGIAATRLGFEFIGIDMTPEYIELAATRIAYWSDNELTFEDGDVVLKPKPQAEWL